MNPVGTKEQREELRRGPSRDSSGFKYVNPRLAALPSALDGLDIAEEMADMFRTQYENYCNCRCCKLLAKWDKWKGERNEGHPD